MTEAHVQIPARNSQWNDIKKCRQYLDEWARERGYDPLDPETWYTVNLKEILTQRVSKLFYLRIQTYIIFSLFRLEDAFNTIRAD